MNQRIGSLACALAIAAALLAHEASAQPLGAFYWQLAPFCNVVALHITQYVTPPGAVYALTGFDDQCGAGQRATLVGTAIFNHDGSIGVGLTIVTAPGGTPVHVDARVAVASLSGPWVDSAGNAGTFAPLSPAHGEQVRAQVPGLAAGSPRPAPASGIAPGSITSAQIAPGAVGIAQLAPGVVGSAQIDPNQVQARVGGTCPVGQYLRGIHPSGAVICEPLLTPNVSTTVDDPANSVGQFSSLAIGVDGLSIISHYDSTADALRVTHCGNAACTAGNVTTAVDDPAYSVGTFTSIAIGADGLPVISHRDDLTEGLRVTHCGNADCTTGTGSIAVADSGDSAGLYTSIAIGVDGLPIISHFDQRALVLRVTHCGNPACTADTVTTTVDDAVDDVGRFSSIAIGVDGLPVISHRDLTNDALRITHCGNTACTAGNVSTTVDNPANRVGSYTSIAIGADGLPITSHWDSTAGALRVTHCGNAACTAGHVSTTVDDPADSVGSLTSIAIDADGLPVISHFDDTARALRVTHCGNAACTAGNLTTTVDDPINGVGSHTSIAIGTDGLPIVSHFDETAAALRVTKCATRTCQ